MLNFLQVHLKGIILKSGKYVAQRRLCLEKWLIEKGLWQKSIMLSSMVSTITLHIENDVLRVINSVWVVAKKSYFDLIKPEYCVLIAPWSAWHCLYVVCLLTNTGAFQVY